MYRYLAAVALAVSILPTPAKAQESDDEWLANCRDNSRDWGIDRYRHCEIRELGMKSIRGALTIDPGMNGGVDVYGWDKDSVAITARIEVNARSGAEADNIARQIKVDASGNAIKVTGGSGSYGRRQHWGVNLVVMLPRRTDLNVSTENGPLSVQDVASKMDLQTQNGPLSLTGVGGDVHASAQNGPLSIELLGTKWDGAGLDAATENGPADLTIPDNYNAKIEFGTVNGPMDVGFPMTVTINGRVRNRISTTLGNGGAPVRVVTTNGPMTVRKSR